VLVLLLVLQPVVPHQLVRKDCWALVVPLAPMVPLSRKDCPRLHDR